MAWIRVSITVPKVGSTPAQRAAARNLASNIIAALPGCLASHFSAVNDPGAPPAKWQTFGVSTTVWDTQAHAQAAHAALVASHGDPIFKAAIQRTRSLPPFQA